METNIVKIGKLKGILIPIEILKLLGIKDKVEMIVEGNKLIIMFPTANPRAKWAEQFQSDNSRDDSSVLIPDVFQYEEFDDWTW